MPLEALFFDVDGTLAETEEVHRAAFNQAFAHFGLSWVWDAVLYGELLSVSGGLERIRHYVLAHAPPGGEMALERIEDIHRYKLDVYTRLVDDGAARLRPGVERLIDEARSRGLKLAIASSTARDNVMALLLATLDTRGPDLFHVIEAGDGGPKKSGLAAYRNALAALGVDPARCIAFEDAPTGLRAAMEAGLRVVVTPSLYTVGRDFTGALAVVSHLGDPFDPYEHIAGEGGGRRLVSVTDLRRWLDDDDDMRSLLTINGKPAVPARG
jgi:HAD superfamily hydrolase (TIGR01509 family)